jgi:hypothetical protein
MHDLEREWTQVELRDYLLANGWTAADFTEGEIIPQGVKYIDFSPLTQADIKRGQEIARELADEDAPSAARQHDQPQELEPKP